MLRAILKRIAAILGRFWEVINKEALDTNLLAVGALLSKQQHLLQSTNINDYEFKIFSEWGDDGIIQYLIKNIAIANNVFIEFGVENYLEANTRFLMMNNNWSGFVMDGSIRNMKSLKRRSWYHKYDLQCQAAWIDCDNVNRLLAHTGFENIGLLHIDLDGNDYFILSELSLSKINPAIIIMEYNALFGCERAISVPYRKDFNRTKAHYSNLFFGASLAAINYVAEKKGYALVGCNLAGNNAYFIRHDLLNEKVTRQAVTQAFKPSKFRQARNKDYSLALFTPKDELSLIKGLPVVNVISGEIEVL